MSTVKKLMQLGMKHQKGELTYKEFKEQVEELTKKESPMIQELGSQAISHRSEPKEPKPEIQVVHLKEPYWGAKARFSKWEYADTVGLGISMEILKDDKELLIVCGENGKWGEFSIHTKEARRITKEGMFFYRAKNDAILAVIPRVLCKVVK